MSEIKKPVITKEQAECLENLRGLSPLTIVAALINGYEVEKTPEEKVREYYAANYQRHEQSMPRSKDDFYTSGVAEGVRNTLDSLGIKIEGVNA
ncbi:hypothetical protein P4T97_06740 [Bacillus paralicheniformis]|uniref:hypothetical protein n=1 Tax=Bacillus paralicheniformis TaxID=1648923 RepID=UPI002E244850|nr:hypothetical protein [Bacillus paralicheniformis]